MIQQRKISQKYILKFETKEVNFLLSYKVRYTYLEVYKSVDK